MKRNDSHSRAQLDARNSETDRVRSFEEIITDNYNNPSYGPKTHAFPLFHHEFTNSFSLPLDPFQFLTVEKTKRLLIKVSGR